MNATSKTLSDDPSTPERLGVYRIESCLGRGGMGEVFLAWDEILERHVAIKRIRRDQLADESRRSRFLREAKAVARLSHPAIVQVFHVLERPESDCLVMEHVRGHDLGKWIASRERTPASAVRLAVDIAEGLAAAHAQGLIHRDLKPANIMVTPSGRVKILDFGLAKSLWQDAESRTVSDPSLTRSGTLVGTAHAMSPEQAGGRTVDHRSDLFALGSLLYEMLSGRPPFLGHNLLDTLHRVQTAAPEPIPDLPAALGSLLQRLLDKDPDGRPSNTRWVARQLSTLADRMERGSAGPDAGHAELKAEGPPLDVDPDQPTAEVVSPLRDSLRHKGAHGLPGPSEAAGIHSDDLLQAETRGPGSDSKPVVRTLAHIGWASETTAYDARASAMELIASSRARFSATELYSSSEDPAHGLTLMFEHPGEAVAFALAWLQSLSSEPSGIRNSLPGIAVHLGEVKPNRKSPTLEAQGEGPEVAELLADRARPGQILLTRAAFDLARAAVTPEELVAPEVRWLAHGAYRFERLDDDLEVFEVGRSGLAPLTAPRESERTRRAVSTGEEPALGWRPAVGQTVPRRPNWRLHHRLGEGGFGEVWLARHKSGEERVFKFCFEADRLRALKREVTLFRLLRETLGHRRDIARILDWDFEAAPFFLEAEYTDGGSLTSWAAQRGGLDAVPLATRLELVAGVAEALAAAHSVGILHKDIKPENVLVAHDPDGRPYARLTDFGVGLLTERDRLDRPGFTVLGFTQTLDDPSSTGGTVRYMAPEVLDGEPATTQADIYALGVLLYQAVVKDFSRTLAAGWHRQVEDPLLAEDIGLCVDGNPARRPASALEVASRIRELEERRAQRQEQERRRVQRERARGRRRLAARLGVAAMVFTALVSVFALQTLRAKNRELEARQYAEQRRSQAENLIDFLLVDLRRDLEPIGKLSILDKIGDQAMEYFAGVPSDRLSEDELAAYAKALHQIGKVRFELGRTPEAEEAFRQSLIQAQSLVDRHGDRADRLFELGQSHFWLGFLHWQQRDLEPAREQFEHYLAISQRLVDREPEQADWQLELAYSHSNLGALEEESGDYPRAADHLEVSARILERLSSDGDPSLGVELAHVYAKLGRVLEAQGRLAPALARYRAHLELMAQASSAQPDHIELLRFLGFAHNHVGDVLRQQGHNQEALEHYLSDLDIASRVVDHDPLNLVWQEELAQRHRNLAWTYSMLDRHEDANRHLARDAAFLEKALDLEPENPRWRPWQASHLWLRAWERLQAADPTAARAEITEAIELLGPVPSTARGKLWKARSGWLLAVIEAELGWAQAARKYRLDALLLADELVEQTRRPTHLDIQLLLLLALRRTDEAQPIADELARIGYREPGFLKMMGRPPR